MNNLACLVIVAVTSAACGESIPTSDIVVTATVQAGSEHTRVAVWVTDVATGDDLPATDVSLVAIVDGQPKALSFNEDSKQHVGFGRAIVGGGDVIMELHRDGEGDALDSRVSISPSFQASANDDYFGINQPVQISYTLAPTGFRAEVVARWQSGNKAGTTNLADFVTEPGQTVFVLEDLIGPRSPSVIPATTFVEVTVSHVQDGTLDPALNEHGVLTGGRDVSFEIRIN